MKILYIHQYFRTYAQGGSSRSYYLSKALVDSGYEVEVITSHNKKYYQKSTIEGITVHYLPVYYDNLLGFTGRLYAFLKFVIQAYKLALSIKNVEVCYATSTPLTVGVIAWLLKKWQGIPYYFEVRDLWPQAPIEMGVIRNSFLKRALFSLEEVLYQEAQKIIALSPGIEQHIVTKVADASKVHMIPNMADCDFFGYSEEKPAYHSAKKHKNTFTIAYFGAVGKVNDLSSLLEIANFFQAKGLYHVQFLLIGKGNQWQQLQNMASDYALNNVKFIPHSSKFELRNMLTSVDAVYVSFAQLPVLETSSPNKFFDGLAAGKLCIVNTKGWIKECIEQAGCGFYADPQFPEQFYKKLLPFMASKHLLGEAQTAARLLAQTQFSRAFLTQYFVSIFSEEPIVAPYSHEAVMVAEEQ